MFFGAATAFSSPIDNNPFVADGMLGLAFSTTTNLFGTLVSQNKQLNPTFERKRKRNEKVPTTLLHCIANSFDLSNPPVHASCIISRDPHACENAGRG